MVLPSMTRQMVKSIENVVRDYIWGGKKSKIALQILQNPKEEGGLNLVNLKNKDIALKATWPRILEKEKEYSQLVYSIMRCSIIQQDIWRCTLLPEHVEVIKIKNTFWQDTLKSWCVYNTKQYQLPENQIIWLNSYIQVQDKPIFWANVYRKGLVYVYQLYEGMEMKSFEKVWEEFRLSKLRYNSINEALPKIWKEYFSTTPAITYMPIPPHNYDKCVYGVLKQNSTVHQIYKCLAEDVTILNNKYLKWEKEIGEEICEGIWNYGKLFKDIYRVTNVPKYRSFQYRLLQRGIVTNIQLEKWGIIPSMYCTFCGKVPETLTHLFVSCEEVKELWINVKEWCEQKYCVRVMIDSKSIITGQLVEQKTHVINLIGLLLKFFVYRQRCLKGSIHYTVFKQFVRKVEGIEKYISVKNGKEIIHRKKWDRMYVGENVQNNQTLNEYVNEYVQNL